VNKFPVIVTGNSILQNIFPTKQRDVQKIIEYSEKNLNILKTTIFGSAITWSCNVTSDIDISLELYDTSEDEFFKITHDFSKILNSEFDVINYKLLNNDILKKEIESKGLVIYDRFA
jgi:predicted nucleotidyltransferase